MLSLAAILDRKSRAEAATEFRPHIPATRRWVRRYSISRLIKIQNGKRCVVVVIRERTGRAITTVVCREADAVDTIVKRVAPGTVVHADEAQRWDLPPLALHLTYDLGQLSSR